MKTLNILLTAAALSVLSTAAFAQSSDRTDIEVARQVVLGNVAASNDSVGVAAGAVVEGRQAASLGAHTLSANDQLLLDQALQRDISHN